MSDQIIQVNEAPKLARFLAAGLVGWLVLLFGAFLAMIAMSALFEVAGIKITLGSGLFVVEIVVALLISAIACYYLTRKAYKWFSSIKPVALYVALVALLCVAVISFPAPFVFTEISSGR